jgi:hypothetical protein
MRLGKIGIAGVVLLGAISVSAHVGSPDVYFEGDAGPYHLYVTVRVPQVIPGIAEIEVRSATNDVERIEIVPMRLSGPGSNFPPMPDVAERSKQDTQFFTGSLWLMEFGALKVRITAEGSKGKGELAVPVPAFAQKSLPMQRPLGGLLGFLMVFLAVGLVFIAGAATREGNLEPGETPSTARNRRARIVMAVMAVVVLGILYLGKAWWGAEAANYKRDVNFFKPPLAETELENGNRLVIRAKGQDPEWSDEVKMKDVIPDHNHLMHLFLISMPGMDGMWHLHPERNGDAFTQNLPNMPAGRYELFADIVDKNGFPWTLVGQVDLPQINGQPITGDDSMWSGPALLGSGGDATSATLANGGRLIWERPGGSLRANAGMNLKFKIEDRDGNPAKDVEPYMGMAGHAEIVRTDWSVFAHIHPAGSVSMAALEMAGAGGALSGLEGAPTKGAEMSGGMAMSQSANVLASEVSFPYGFPKPGEYRIFVQIKRAGQVETGVFDTRVE